MKNLFTIILLLLLPFKFCLAQDLNMAKVAKDWDKIKADFAKELNKDPEIKAVYDSKLKWRILNSAILFEIKESDDLLNKNLKTKYEKIRKDFIAELAKNPKYAIPTGDAKDDLIKKYESEIAKLTAENAKLKDDVNRQKKQLTSKDNALNKEKNKSFIDTVADNLLIYVIAVVELVAIIFLLIKWNKLQNDKEDLKYEIKDREKEISRLTKQQPKEKIVEKVVEKTIEKPVEKIVYVEKKKQEEKPKEYKYLCQINGADGGYFKRVQDRYDGSSSYYRMYDEKDGEAEFEFFGDAERAIKKWSSILDSVAEYDGDTDTASKIKTEEPGKVKYDAANERWKVTKKAKLKLS